MRKFAVSSSETVSVCSLRFQPNVNFSLEYLSFEEGLSHDIASTYFENWPDIVPIRFNGKTYGKSIHWSEDEYEEIKKGLSKSALKEFEDYEYIENLKFERLDYAKFGLWEYSNINFYFDKNSHLYFSFNYYDKERDTYLTGFVPISKEKLGEFFYYCHKIEFYFGIYIIAP